MAIKGRLTGRFYRRDRPLLGGTGKAIAFIGSDPGTVRSFGLLKSLP
jgi:hypothetical protein